MGRWINKGVWCLQEVAGSGGINGIYWNAFLASAYISMFNYFLESEWVFVTGHPFVQWRPGLFSGRLCTYVITM